MSIPSGPSGISRLIYEYEISRSLEVEGIIKPIWLEQEGMVFALIMEDIGAVSLREYMQYMPPKQAGRMAQTAGYRVEQGIISIAYSGKFSNHSSRL